MKSYDYVRQHGVIEISWNNFSGLAQQLSLRLEDLNIQGIVGVARGGLFPAKASASKQLCELYPDCITRRLNDQVLHNGTWITCPEIVEA